MRTLWPVFMGIAVFLGGASAGAQAEKGTQLDIQSQVLTDALNQWAQAAGFKLIGPSAPTLHLRSPQLQGTFTPRAALERLLAGTSLTYEFIDERTVAIHERAPESLPSSATGKQAENQSLHLLGAQGTEVRRSSGTRAEPEDRPNRSTDDVSDTDKRSRSALEEVVVTAQKRSERLQDVPISISVIDGGELDSFRGGITEALSRVPGVSMSQGLIGGGTQLVVRGVTAAGPTFSGSNPIAYYLDALPFGLVRTAIVPDSNAYDLNRIEVLRGPQGTLYGASALNGVVRVLTNDADLNDFDLKARVLGSQTELGGDNYRGDMAMNVPIVTGKLAIRGVVSNEHQSGWIESGNKRDVNDADVRTYRLKVNAQPTDELSIVLAAGRSQADYGALSTADENNTNLALMDQPIATDFDTYSLKIGYDFPAFTFTSMTSYIDFENRGYLDLVPSDTAEPLFFTSLNSRVFSEEIVFTSKQVSPWSWSAGVFYRDGKDSTLQSFGAPFDDFTDFSESWAVFGELSRKFLNDRFQWTLGARHFRDDSGTQANTLLPSLPDVTLEPQKFSFESTTPRAVLTWAPDAHLTIYASYSQGFRSGLAQTELVTQAAPTFAPAKPDKLTNYELGAKGTLWDRRVSFDTALYYIYWKDAQQVLGIPVGDLNVFATVNGTSASGLGFDFSVTTELVDGLEWNVGLSWNDLRQDHDVFSAGALLFREGDRLGVSPEITASSLLQYSWPLGDRGYRAQLSASANYTSRQDTYTIEGVWKGDPILLARTSFSIDSPEHWSATLFVDNVNNERGSPTRTVVDFYSLRVRPRTVGMQLEYRF